MGSCSIKQPTLVRTSSILNGRVESNVGLLLPSSWILVEALNGTLRAAKRQKKVSLHTSTATCWLITLYWILQVSFDAELLMMPKDKDTLVTLL